MSKFVAYENGVVVGIFNARQPDALDDAGKVACPGVATVELSDDHPDIAAYFDRINAPLPVQPTLQEVIDALPQASKDALNLTMATTSVKA